MKVYADTPHGPTPGASLRSSGRAKADCLGREGRGGSSGRACESKEGMQPAAFAGVETIDHGDAGDVEVFD